MDKFLRKFKFLNKIAGVNSILITKSINLQLFTLILYSVGVRCGVDTFKLTASAQSINRELYESINCISQFRLQIYRFLIDKLHIESVCSKHRPKKLFFYYLQFKGKKVFFNTLECLLILYTSCKTLHSVC